MILSLLCLCSLLIMQKNLNFFTAAFHICWPAENALFFLMAEVMLGLAYRSSVLIPLRFLEMLLFLSSLLLLTQCGQKKKKKHFQNAVAFIAILSLSFLPRLACINLQVENATTDLANAQENVLSIHIMKILCSR